ncbi:MULTISPECIES: hypothetical protein [Acinetobacter]|uniref:hypothetical protein n=1 Tax=Acinetobacter TaxID=469 RepID=UPI0015D33F74|nr:MULTISPECIES: hypothetical protein [Acinetobacter]MCW1881343.1 hypothetical protein [Acinetobacter baumannii]MCW1896465.1 hypothetical protein [Acinetobacter baumannii]UUG47803.1 hypothetical protein NP567_00010 [Acinetobacter baumannii]UUG50866.1 hypothetical protein NP563_00010 [Acinetobacter baumannii]
MTKITLNSVTFDFSVESNSEQAFTYVKSIGFNAYIPERYSSIIASQVLCLAKSRILNSYTILDTIKTLEGIGYPSKLKAETEFMRLPLKGLWHKHYLPNNIQAFAKNLINSIKVEELPSLDELAHEAGVTNEERYLTERDIALITHDAVVGAWERRCRSASVTGEWIIYAKYQGQNYYLCLAKHSDGDDKIRALIDAICIHEFPFLQDILS